MTSECSDIAPEASSHDFWVFRHGSWGPQLWLQAPEANSYDFRPATMTSECSDMAPEASSHRPLLLNWINLNSIMVRKCIHHKVWDEITNPWNEITNPFQTSTVQLPKFGNGRIILSAICRTCDYLSMLGWNLIHVSKKGTGGVNRKSLVIALWHMYSGCAGMGYPAWHQQTPGVPLLTQINFNPGMDK